MSLLEGLRKKKSQLIPTATLVTTAQGKQFIEEGTRTTQLTTTNYGFVVDTKPDKIPAKILNYLYLGSQDAADISVLEEYDITHVLSVGITLPELKSNNDRKIVNKHLACLDLPETSLATVLHEAFEFIDAAITLQRNVLVHCNAGVSRSPAIVIAYLIRRHGMTFHAAHAHVKQARPSIRPNDGFVQQLQTW